VVKHPRSYRSFTLTLRTLLLLLLQVQTLRVLLNFAIMRYVVSASAGTLVWAALLGCCLKADYTLAASDESSMVPKSEEDSNSQLDSSMSKRDWNRNLHSWGKRAWQNLQGGWGKRDSSYPLYYPYADKRAWQNLQGGWGKRFAPEDEYAVKQLAALLEQEEQDPQYAEFGPLADNDVNDDDKRAWKGLNGGWGKRSDSWGNFRGSWGKRDPAWTNLKGIWGKRSYPDRIAQ